MSTGLELHICNVRNQLLDDRECLLHARSYLGLDVVEEILARNSDFQPGHIAVERSPIAGPGRARIGDQRPEQKRRISHRACHRPNRIERCGEWDHSLATQQACARTKSDGPATVSYTHLRAHETD